MKVFNIAKSAEASVRIRGEGGKGRGRRGKGGVEGGWKVPYGCHGNQTIVLGNLYQI
jgi:hypothetical protein